MSYRCDLNGTITVKENTPDWRMQEIMDLARDYYIDEAEQGMNSNDIDIRSNEMSYHDDELAEFYGKIADDVKEATIDFEGEDGTRWRHECKDGKWCELEAETVYKNPTEIVLPKEQDMERE